jgi:hypothetical protein
MEVLLAGVAEGWARPLPTGARGRGTVPHRGAQEHRQGGIAALSRSPSRYRRRCDQGAAPIEADLPRVAGYTVKGDVLELLDGHKYPVLALSRITPTGLENRAWSIDQYFDGAMLVTAPPVTEITFMNGGVDGGSGVAGFQEPTVYQARTSSCLSPVSLGAGARPNTSRTPIRSSRRFMGAASSNLTASE